MQCRLFTVVLFFLSFGLFAAASPVEKRVSVVMDAISKLSSDVSSVLSAGNETLVARQTDIFADNINSITAAFATATNTLRALTGPVSLSPEDTNTIAQLVANQINGAAELISLAPQTTSILTATVLLDLQINLFLNIFGVVVIGIIDIIASLIINIQLLISVYLTAECQSRGRNSPREMRQARRAVARPTDKLEPSTRRRRKAGRNDGVLFAGSTSVLNLKPGSGYRTLVEPGPDLLSE
ncbi:hypothetical protein AURDEDRAFT_129535 [Auricularia subglabra TFB-10046 SS5]|uniref:Uncharacterized protein n=1 Tax=Auricularia subglabra (strain TFB-10046 / SS5) TaxID=717982 RepID=J0CZU5_AURST|nr:hypothetical protein AURDEDRAFT_129535 [Auricularia subglabra TFB-10046 SS5]